jgi:uncharacterized protein YkwD/uncharacterized membrane protein required for colicin V production
MTVPDNWIDIAIVVILAWNIADGIRKGFIPALFDLAAFVAAVLVALSAYVVLGEWINAQWGIPTLLAQPVAFAATWIVTSIVVGIAGHFLGAPFAALLHGKSLDLVLSVIPSGLKGLVVSGLLLLVIMAIPPVALGLPGAEVLASARESIQQSLLATQLLDRTAALDRYARELVGDPISQSLTLLTIHPDAGERVDLDFRVPNPPIDTDAETRMLLLLNGERLKAGLKPLVRDPELEKVARAHSVDMLQRGYFAHETPEGRTPFDRIREAAIGFTIAGENLALAQTVDLAHQGLMDSPGHRANILRPEFGRVGIGAARGDGHGRMFTQNFAN